MQSAVRLLCTGRGSCSFLVPVLDVWFVDLLEVSSPAFRSSHRFKRPDLAINLNIPAMSRHPAGPPAQNLLSPAQIRETVRGGIYGETSPLWSHPRLLFRMLSPSIGSPGFLHLLELLLCIILRLRVVEEFFNQCAFTLCTRKVTAGWFAKGRLRGQDRPDLPQERNEVMCLLISTVVLRTAKYFGNPLIPLPSPWSFR